MSLLMKSKTLLSLPDQCHHHYRVKVANSGALEDDYYVRFEGSNDQDGQGVWQEWRGFGVRTTIDAARCLMSWYVCQMAPSL